jgi:hypothetical protein
MARLRGKRLGYPAFLLVVSGVGLTVLVTLLMNPPYFSSAPGYRWPLTVFIYDIVCVAGILAVLFPVACSRAFGVHYSTVQSSQVQAFGIRATRVLGLLIVHGHHPPGSESASHELLVGRRSFCATCYGLLTGAVVSLTLITASAVAGFPAWLASYSANPLYYAGLAGVIAGLLFPLITDLGAKTRYVLAFVFVVGTSLILLGVEQSAANLTADLFVVLLAVFWLLSRITLSHRS